MKKIFNKMINSKILAVLLILAGVLLGVTSLILNVIVGIDYGGIKEASFASIQSGIYNNGKVYLEEVGKLGRANLYVIDEDTEKAEFVYTGGDIFNIENLTAFTVDEAGNIYIATFRYNFFDLFFNEDYQKKYYLKEIRSGEKETVEIADVSEMGQIGDILYDEGKIYCCSTSDKGTALNCYDINNEKMNTNLFEIEKTENVSLIDEDKLLAIDIYGNANIYDFSGQLKYCFEADFSSEDVTDKKFATSGCIIDDQLYLLGGTGQEKIYNIDTGTTIDLADTYDRCISTQRNNNIDRNTYSIAKHDDGLCVFTPQTVIIIDKEGNVNKCITGATLPTPTSVRVVAQKSLSYLAWGFIILGVIVLSGSIVHWRMSLLARNLIIVPIVIIMITVISISMLSGINGQRKDLNKNELKSASILLANQIKAEDLNIYDLSSDEYHDSNNDLKNLFEKIEYGRDDKIFLYVYKKINEQSWTQVIGSRNKTNLPYLTSKTFPTELDFSESPYVLFEGNDSYRGAYYSALSPIYDGDEVAGIVQVIYENVDVNVYDNFFIIAFYSFPFIIILIITLVLLTNYILRNLRNISKTVKGISEGNYVVKIDKIRNDELGDICKGVNTMSDKIQHMQDSMITGMATMVECRDNSTGGHIKRTSAVVRVFAEKLSENLKEFGIDEDFLFDLAKAAPMHDLGKISVDDEILRKPGKFTPEEYEIMKTHAANGAVTVANLLDGVEDESFVKIAINVAHYHHEKWDGSGYPEKLSGEAIPIEARIMALADVFDALVSKRCYKDSFDYDRAFKIIEESSGSHFDPRLSVLFLECREQLEALYDEVNE